MSINARTATAKDFERAAQNHANSFWWRLITTGVVYYFLGIYAIIPATLAVLSIIKSTGATSAAIALRKGNYKISNPNNGAPDGDARNYLKDEV